MRKILGLFVGLSLLTISANAQFMAPAGIFPGQTSSIANFSRLSDTASLNKKWSFNKYAAFSAGYMFTGAGSASVLAMPLGLQVTRRITNNIFAFAGVSVAPTYFNPTGIPLNGNSGKNYPGYNLSVPNRFGGYAGVDAGFMYVNDERTFSISGSVNFGRSSYPAYPYGQFGARPARANGFQRF
ncbi:MAG: hypothetical protein EOO02_11400 [Chitinophagaceae bacterium]|nr:MAG: hypothetical protein EOO02_11400 [Chitinophagaceae bacterium]